MRGTLFDPQAPLDISEHYRPHWSQAGAIVFVSFRTKDSIPRSVVRAWELEKRKWLRDEGRADFDDWRAALGELDESRQRAFRQRFQRAREDFLDTCHGKCVLRDPVLGKIVADTFTLLHFDGDRYCMGDFIVMPNHVHLLVSFPNQATMRKQFDSWLHYSAWQINKLLRESGSFWQEEPFDHLVRSNSQYDYLRRYIAENPRKAGIGSGSYIYRKYTDSIS